MRTILALSLLVLGCVHAAPVAVPTAPTPDRVCMMIASDLPSAKCTHEGDNPFHGHIARVDNDGGSKLCWETFTKAGYDCTTFLLSKAETAQVAVDQERKRVEAEAKAKAAEPTKPVDAAKPADVKPEPKAKAPAPPPKDKKP